VATQVERLKDFMVLRIQHEVHNGEEPAAPSDSGIIASVGGRGVAGSGSKNKLRTVDGFVKGSYK
jgi:hypothetical protein